jgi:hypothetical protein
MEEAATLEGAVANGSGAGRYLFRADDNDRGGPVGRALGPEADASDIQNFADHVLRKESRRTSRFTSFTTEVKLARKFTSASDNRFIRKADPAKLRGLESQGTIRMWDPDRVFEVTRDGPRKLARQAADVRAAMRRNSEILIEGRIPAEVLRPVTD